MIKVLFVCHGKICRSVIAEYISKSKTGGVYCDISYEEEGNDIFTCQKVFR